MVRILEREEICLQSDTVAIGWAQARGLNDPQLTLETLKPVILTSYPQYQSPYALGQVAGIVWRFVREIAVGDWIVAPTRTGLNIAKVTGPLLYDIDLVAADSAWRYPVQWVRLDVPRDTASGGLQARCSSRQTCVEATDLLVEIERLSRQEGKPNLAAAILSSEASTAIGQVLDGHLTPADLEQLVLRLAERSGASVEQPPKNYSNKKGDVDVIATYKFPPYVIGYQVKKHCDVSVTDEDAVQQIIDVMESEYFAIDIGCVVTMAGGFSPSAKALAAASPVGPVRLMTRADLVQWVLSTGISSLK